MLAAAGRAALRILYWQTTQSPPASPPSTFDRFLKNWMDMIALIYAGMWSLAPRDCLLSAPHQFVLATVLVVMQYASLLLRGLVWLAVVRGATASATRCSWCCAGWASG